MDRSLIVNTPTNHSTEHTKADLKPRLLRGLLQVLLITVAAIIGYALIEVADNPTFWAVAPHHVANNIEILFVLLGIVYLVGQRTRGSIVFFWAACMLWGIAQHYVIMFKDQPILPADVLALETAAAVSANYDYTPDAKSIASVVIFLIATFLLLKFVPRIKGYLTPKVVAINLALALVACGGFYAWMTFTDIESDYDAHVGIWGSRESYEEKGTMKCFISRIQALSPSKPDDYSVDAVNQLLAEEEGKLPTASGEATQPTVLCIMNETLADMSYFPGLEGTAAGLTQFQEIAEGSVVHGYTWTSVSGGGTCNSEFEFLTGSSMCNIEASNYPYMMYDLSGNENLAAYFAAAGYSTYAMHPAEAKNWRRDRVYDQLGFQQFDDIETFRSWADTIRGLVTDKATYQHCLELIEEDEGPAFIFDVTIQNHSGYDTGQVPADMTVSLGKNNLDTPEVDEYLSLLHQSDNDFAWLIKQLENLDEPVVMVIFGDHQATVSADLFEACYGIKVEDATAEEIQVRYQTPYMIWANYDLEEGWTGKPTACNPDGNAPEDTTSINYLGATLVKALGMPLTDYQSFMLRNRAVIPAVNSNVYMDADGKIHGMDAEPASEQDAAALNNYAMLQYANLFDKNAGKGLFLGRQ